MILVWMVNLMVSVLDGKMSWSLVTFLKKCEPILLSNFLPDRRDSRVQTVWGFDTCFSPKSVIFFLKEVGGVTNASGDSPSQPVLISPLQLKLSTDVTDPT